MLAGETIAAVTALDLAFAIRHTVATILVVKLDRICLPTATECSLHLQGFKAYAKAASD